MDLEAQAAGYLTTMRARTALITVGLVWSFIEDFHLPSGSPWGLKKSYRGTESEQRLQMHCSGVGLVAQCDVQVVTLG